MWPLVVGMLYTLQTVNFVNFAVQMPAPLLANQVNMVPSSTQQVINFDVNAAVNSFIGYGSSL